VTDFNEWQKHKKNTNPEYGDKSGRKRNLCGAGNKKRVERIRVRSETSRLLWVTEKNVRGECQQRRIERKEKFERALQGLGKKGEMFGIERHNVA